MAPLLAVRQQGSGPPLVLVHGIATDMRIWDGVVPELARGWRVVSVDVPGFGRSAPVDEDFDLHTVSERIARGLAAQGVSGPVDLIGHSLGGGIAIALAARRPRLIRRLLLVAPAGLRPMPPGASNALAAGADLFLAARRSVAGLSDTPWGRRVLMAMTAADGAQLPAQVAREMVEASALALRTGPALRTITSSDLRPELERVRAPIGVIWGEADRTVPVSALQEILRLRPDARVVRIPDAGHVPMVERPGEFVAAVRELMPSA